jgi:hypothetical protein
MAFLSYVGIGQLGKWLIEKFYPWTRLLWGDLLAWLKLPNISNLEKDALTALLFFMPLAISAMLSAVWAREGSDATHQQRRSDVLTAMFFGGVFFFLICGSLVSGLVRAN